MHKLDWPFSGLDLGRSYQGQAHGTTVDCLNVVNIDPATGRSRGAKRAGTSKYLAAQHTAARVQDIIASIVSQQVASSGTAHQVRTIKGVAVAGGNIKTFTGGSFSTPTNGSGALDSDAPVIFSALHFGDVYFCDGEAYKVLDISAGSVATWSASTAGTIPANGSYRCRLIENWRNRIALAGLRGDEHNLFLSALDDPFDFDYTPSPERKTQAVAGNEHAFGKCPDIINSLCALSDDILLGGCDHTLWVLRGDPMYGGVWDNVSRHVGMAFGRPWDRLPDGSVLFFGSRGGIFRLSPSGGEPQELTSTRLKERLADVDLDTTSIRLAWDDRFQHLHVFLTPLTSSTATTHYTWDARNDAWLPFSFADTDHNPTAVYVFDGDDSDDRVILLGGHDGYIRQLDAAADDDDGEAINAYVLLGPIQGKGGETLRLEELELVLGENSDAVTVTVLPAATAEAAHDATAKFTFTASAAGRNRIRRPRTRGAAQYIKLAQTAVDTHFSFEQLRLRTSERTGPKARRLF